MKKSEIIKVLMERDGMTETEAREELAEVMEEVRDLIASGNFIEAEDLFSDMLGLEPDYLI